VDSDFNGVPDFSEADFETWIGKSMASESEAQGYITTHESTYVHADIATALQPEDIDTEAELESVSNTSLATEAEAAAAAAAAASSAVGEHESAYNHVLIASAVQPGNILDEDDFASNSASWPPSQQSAKAYIDGLIAYVISLIGSASTTLSEGDSSFDIDDGVGGAGQAPLVIDGIKVFEAKATGITTGNTYLGTTLSSDDTFVGKPASIGAAGENLDQWTLVKLLSDGLYYKADANASGMWPADGITLAAVTDYTVDPTCYVGDDLWGRDDGRTFTAGGWICLSETAGVPEDCATTLAAWDTDGDCGQVVGKAKDTHTVRWDFSHPAFEHN
jgi:hypothetical protein